jgi:hypothetical protein
MLREVFLGECNFEWACSSSRKPETIPIRWSFTACVSNPREHPKHYHRSPDRRIETNAYMWD